MRTSRLGREGPEISRLGIGGWQGSGSGPWSIGPGADDDEAIAAIRRAVEGRVTWIDTAASYGLGHSEEIVRRALEPWRVGDEVLVFTKCAHPWEPPDRIWTELTAASIRRECEGSLRRLDVERLDLLQFHHPDPKTPVEESWSTMAELVLEGKVRWAGLSNFGTDLLERCETIRHVDSLQPELSLIRRRAREDVIPWSLDHDTGVIVYSPLASGLLSGARDRAWLEAASDEDRMDVSADALWAFVERMRPIASRLGTTLPALATAWTLAVEGVTAAICGARRPGQVEGWIAATEVVLDADAVRDIEAALASTGTGEPR